MINLGRHSYCYGLQRGIANNVNVGNFTSIAEGVIFDGGFNHNRNNVSTFPFSTIWSELKSNIVVKGDINIGHDVWIGEGAMIMSGVTIGNGAIIGARTVVTKDVESYCVVVGSPMVYIYPRYEYSDRLLLEDIAWWNWSDEKIKENTTLLQSDNIRDFINKHTL